MPARSFGYAEVEQRLQEIRRRLNLLALQKAVYAAASVGFLGIALLIVVAVFGGGTMFRATLWFVGATCVAALAFGARFVLRRLVSVEDAARFADRHAKLQDRLATLHAQGKARTPSRLAELLLADALNFAPRWKVSGLGLRRVPRSIYLMILSAMLLASTAFLETPPGEKPGEKPPRSRDRQTAAAEAEAPPPVQRVLRRTSGTDKGMVGLGQVGDGTDDGAGAFGGEGEHATARRQGSPSQDPSNSSKAGKQSASTGAGSRDTLTQLQQRIRDTLGESGAGELDAERDVPGAKLPRDRQARAETRDRPRPERNGDPSDQLEGKPKAPSADGQQATGSARGQKSAREGEGQGGGKLFGSGKPDIPGSGSSQKFTLRLAGAQNARVRLDPQGRGNEAPLAVDTGGDGGAFDVPEQGVPDGALQRPEVSPEHEAILGRIFRRD